MYKQMNIRIPDIAKAQTISNTIEILMMIIDKMKS